MPKPISVRLREVVRDPNKPADQRMVDWRQDFAAPDYGLTVEDSFLVIAGTHATRAIPLSSVSFLDVAPASVAAPVLEAKKKVAK